MILLRSTALILLATASIALLSGCTGETGRATPGTQTGSATGTSTQPSTSFEGVELDLGKFASKPCDALTAVQATSLGSFRTPAPGTGSGILGPSCVWQAQKVLEGATYEITMVTEGSTLQSMTEVNKTLDVFRETKVAGYSAISWDQTTGKGNCSTAVGTSSKDAILVQMNVENTEAPEYKDSCGASEQVAALVVQNLKG
jgi:hypothetical protein